MHLDHRPDHQNVLISTGNHYQVAGIALMHSGEIVLPLLSMR